MERLVLRSYFSPQSGHARFSGEEDIEINIRIWLNAERSWGQMVRLEIERIDHSYIPPRSRLESDLHASLEDATAFLHRQALPPKVAQLVHQELAQHEQALPQKTA